jgi:NitT/TauT family transport system substrate-binding protein
LLIGLAGCGPPTPNDPALVPPGAGQTALAKIDLLLNWFPEAEHGGYYAALVHGYFREEGLEVTIRPGGPGVPVLSQVASRRVAFGISSADSLLLGWAQQARTVAIFAPLQHSPRCIMVHERSGIRSFDDLKNLTLAMNASSTFSLFLQKKVPLTGVRIVPYAGNVAQFLVDDRYAQQAFVFSEPFVARRQGGDPHTLMVSDLGFDPYTGVLITHPEMIAQQPETVRRMVRAAVRGWQRYLQDPQETNRHLSRLNADMDPEILAYGASQLRPLCLPEDPSAENVGGMHLPRWQQLVRQLEEVESLKPGAVDPRQVFTDRFLPEAKATAP